MMPVASDGKRAHIADLCSCPDLQHVWHHIYPGWSKKISHGKYPCFKTRLRTRTAVAKSPMHPLQAFFLGVACEETTLAQALLWCGRYRHKRLLAQRDLCVTILRGWQRCRRHALLLLRSCLLLLRLRRWRRYIHQLWEEGKLHASRSQALSEAGQHLMIFERPDTQIELPNRFSYHRTANAQLVKDVCS